MECQADALTEALRQLGFSEIEARTYETLARIQPATAYEVAKRAGLPRANVYNAVSVLLSRGALQPVTEGPVRYVLSDPDAFFRHLSIETSRHAESATAAVRRLAPQNETPFVKHVRGREALLRQINQAFDAAQHRIFIKTTDALAAAICAPLKLAAARGVTVTIVASGTGWEPLQGIPNLMLMPHEGTWSTPSRPHQLLLTTTIDTETLIIATFGKAPYGYVASDGGLIYVIQTMILHELYLAEIYRAIGPERLAESGVSFSALRERFRPPDIDRRLLDEAKGEES